MIVAQITVHDLQTNAAIPGVHLAQLDEWTAEPTGMGYVTGPTGQALIPEGIYELSHVQYAGQVVNLDQSRLVKLERRIVQLPPGVEIFSGDSVRDPGAGQDQPPPPPPPPPPPASNKATYVGLALLALLALND